MKSLISSMLLLLVLLLPATAFAYDFEVDGIYYNINGNDVAVTYSGSSLSIYSGAVVIPATVTYNGTTYPVTSIGNSAFYGCSGLASINIPNSVTSIGNSAFRDCTGLTSIDIPNSVTSIGWDAFRDCIGLMSINIPNSVTSIGEYAFDNTAWYDNQPDGLVYAGLVAYKYKGTMPDGTSIVLKEGTLGISGEAFSWCTGLTNIFIPNSVTSINNSALWGCSGLMSIVVDSGNPNYDSRNNCNAIIESASNILIAGCKNTIIPNSVTSIGNYAFHDCVGLTSINIPNSVTTIGATSFVGCSGLTSINIPKSVTSISNYAFAYCSGLMIIVVESGNPNYDSRNNCNAIIETASNTLIAGCKNTIIPNSVTSIDDYAFSGCLGLTSVNIPNSVTSIGWRAFYGCSGLTSINIPISVTSIGSYAFSGCTGLSVLYFDAKSCADFSSRPFENLNISTINIGDNVQRIPARLAAGLTKLLKIIIPNSVIEIGNDMNPES